jgi:hypothetical protein
MNGHFSAVGDQPASRRYEHGVQVIDEDKEFKYVSLCSRLDAQIAVDC